MIFATKTMQLPALILLTALLTTPVVAQTTEKNGSNIEAS